MAKLLTLMLLGLSCLLVYSIPMHRFHLRQLPPALQFSWATSSTISSVQQDTTAFGTPTSLPTSERPANQLAPFLWEPTIPLPSTVAPLSVSFSTTVQTVSEIFTSTVYEVPETVMVTPAPTTVTNTITVSEPFTATPGSFWSAPARFSNLDSFKIAHFASGEDNLRISNDVPSNAVDDSLLTLPLLGFDNNVETSYSPNDTWNASSALELFYPQDSINPGNSPQGGADFYATPLPLADATNVTLEYSVFFPKDFDWVRGGKLPGLYGGHMTCSGGDNATSCFSTRLMWREGGTGELYLYAPKDKQSYALCHAPPESVCNAEYGLSVGRGSFKFSSGTWTNTRQTVILNTPGKHDGGFSLEVNGNLIMDRHDVFYRDVPSPAGTASGGSQTNGDDDADDGGLLSPLIGSVLKPVDRAGVNQGILPPFVKNNDSSPFTTSLQYPLADRPPLLSLQQPISALPITYDAASALIYDLTASRSGMPGTVLGRPTVTQTAPQATVTIANYLWQHAFTGPGKEKAVLGVSDANDSPKPISFSGLFFSTFFGGNSEEYATPKDQYTWFKDFAITINS